MRFIKLNNDKEESDWVGYQKYIKKISKKVRLSQEGFKFLTQGGGKLHDANILSVVWTLPAREGGFGVYDVKSPSLILNLTDHINAAWRHDKIKPSLMTLTYIDAGHFFIPSPTKNAWGHIEYLQDVTINLHEFEVLKNGFYKHSILLHNDAVLEIEFKKFRISHDYNIKGQKNNVIHGSARLEDVFK